MHKMHRILAMSSQTWVLASETNVSLVLFRILGGFRTAQSFVGVSQFTEDWTTHLISHSSVCCVHMYWTKVRESTLTMGESVNLS